jgi:hypothetical protein
MKNPRLSPRRSETTAVVRGPTGLPRLLRTAATATTTTRSRGTTRVKTAIQTNRASDLSTWRRYGMRMACRKSGAAVDL